MKRKQSVVIPILDTMDNNLLSIPINEQERELRAYSVCIYTLIVFLFHLFCPDSNTQKDNDDVSSNQMLSVEFGMMWNEIISSWREEDIISNKEEVFLKFQPTCPSRLSSPPSRRPSESEGASSAQSRTSIRDVCGQPNALLQWPLMLLSGKLFKTVNEAMEVIKSARSDDVLFKRYGAVHRD